MQEFDPELEKKEILNRYRDLLKVCKPRTSNQDKQQIRKAFNLALEAHKDMRRKSGEPYIYHPIEVAIISAGEIGLGTTSIICALLHDVVEDTDYTLEDIRGLFGDKVARIIDGLTKISGLFDQKTESLQAENFRKMLLTLSDDVRVILIKLADRLHNMRTLESLPHEKRLKIASETTYLYAPLAHRLGLYAIKSELEDLAFKFMEPEIYNTITEKIRESEPERKRFITRFVLPIKKALTSQGIAHTILGRTKSIYSIWEKMRKKEIPLEEVYDLFAVRIIIDSSLEHEKIDCWRVYTIITRFYRPNQDRLRDWISIPKANGYEALHTTVMSQTGQWVEVQIRSRRMDEIAEKGYAAHWKYKDKESQEGAIDEWLAKIRELLQSPESNALDFLDDFKLNLFADEMFVFTPKGDLITIPVGSTALDFAYSIHSQVGNSCIGAKVNHKLVPLSHRLKSGDQVEIITSEKQTPKEEWFGFVITARAKTQIKAFIKEERKKQASAGKEKLQELFDELQIEFTTANLNKFMYFAGLTSQTELFLDIASGKLGVRDLRDCMQAPEKEGFFRFLKMPFNLRRNAENRQTGEKKAEEEDITRDSLLSPEVDRIHYELSKCCNPIPGDDVIGILSGSEKIIIHRTNCTQAVELMSRFGNKLVKPKWTPSESLEFLAGVNIQGIDRVGLMNEITKVISKQMNINMSSVNLASRDGMFEGIMMLYIHNTEQLRALINSLKKINGIEKVRRIN
jgi:GTP diphosphokinase / guanosine-3',5'-bis(diphosphate) 3'-diphosphatase